MNKSIKNIVLALAVLAVMFLGAIYGLIELVMPR